MKLHPYTQLGFAALSLVALAACAPTTQLTSSWADPTMANRGFKKVVVVGASPNNSVRRMFEDQFAAVLKTRGIEGIQSYTFAGEGQIDKDAAAAKLRDLGVDGVIVTRLIDKETVQTYYPPTYSSVAAPAPYYGGWYGYYSMGYSYQSSPGYVAEDHVYRIETNMYDLQNDKLAWSGLTETTLSSGSAPETEIKPFIDLIAYNMEKTKVLPKAKK
jgi:hypothetical protein